MWYIENVAGSYWQASSMQLQLQLPTGTRSCIFFFVLLLFWLVPEPNVWPFVSVADGMSEPAPARGIWGSEWRFLFIFPCHVSASRWPLPPSGNHRRCTLVAVCKCEYKWITPSSQFMPLPWPWPLLLLLLLVLQLQLEFAIVCVIFWVRVSSSRQLATAKRLSQQLCVCASWSSLWCSFRPSIELAGSQSVSQPPSQSVESYLSRHILGLCARCNLANSKNYAKRKKWHANLA